MTYFFLTPRSEKWGKEQTKRQLVYFCVFINQNDHVWNFCNSIPEYVQPTSNQVGQRGVQVASDSFGGGRGCGWADCHACGHGGPTAPRGAPPGALWRHSGHQQVA